MRKAVVASFVLFFLVLAGCASTNREGLLAAGYAPEYVDGYVDGYAAGCHAIGHPFYKFERDPSRFESDRRYKRGWEDGFTIARCDYAAIW
jgi:hypothetical protein